MNGIISYSVIRNFQESSRIFCSWVSKIPLVNPDLTSNFRFYFRTNPKNPIHVDRHLIFDSFNQEIMRHRKGNFERKIRKWNRGKKIAGLTRSDSVTHAFRNSVVRGTQKRVRGSFSLVSPSLFAGRIRVIREIGARPAGDCVTRVTANRSTARWMLFPMFMPDCRLHCLLGAKIEKRG